MTLFPADYTILAIETSCDETAAAVVRGGRTILSNVVASQIEAHRRYGGVVPEVASRQHILALVPVIAQAINEVAGGWDAIHAVAATNGPGLSGALLTGLNAAKALAFQRGLPFFAINHLESHIYANWLDTTGPGTNSTPPQFPLVALVVSGGHTLIALLREHGRYELLGQTRDDAVGEAFDKVARILGLGFPGGPAIQQAAETSPGGGVLPRAWLRDSYDFSFSGIKTAVLHKVQERRERDSRTVTSGERPRTAPKSRGESRAVAVAPSDEPMTPEALPAAFVAQMAAAFQDSVVDVLVTKVVDAARRYKASEILLAGGVAANTRLRAELSRRAGLPVRYPPIDLCTDNAAMVAAAAYYRGDDAGHSGWGVDIIPNLPLGG